MEEWRPITRSRGQYEVSSLGRVRNVRTGRIRKLCTSKSGVRMVSLGGYIKKSVTIGQLVAEAFYGVKPYRIRHKNGIPWDDRPENIIILEDYNE